MDEETRFQPWINALAKVQPRVYVAPTAVLTCGRVTGSSAQPHEHAPRRGPQREDGRYVVLCGSPARWRLPDGEVTCNACLPYVLIEIGWHYTPVEWLGHGDAR